MQFKIPQDVQREDTIVGPLTMRQLIITAVGGGITYGIYTFLSNTYTWQIWFIPTLMLAAITIAFAFIKVHELSFTQYLVSGAAYLFLPRQRIWIKGSGDPVKTVEQPKITPTEKSQAQKKEKQEDTIKKLDSLVSILDSKGIAKKIQ